MSARLSFAGLALFDRDRDAERERDPDRDRARAGGRGIENVFVLLDPGLVRRRFG